MRLNHKHLIYGVDSEPERLLRRWYGYAQLGILYQEGPARMFRLRAFYDARQLAKKIDRLP